MDKDSRCGYVGLIGRPNVGKSTLLNRILGQKISITSRRPQTTRHRVLGIKTEDSVQTIYVDTPGIHAFSGRAMNRHMNRAASRALQDVDIVVFLVEGVRWTADDELVLEKLQDLECPVILAVNKVDLLDSKDELLPWLKVGWKLRRSGQPDMMEFLRVLPLPVRDYLDSWFANKALKGVLSVPAVAGGMPGPYAAGTTLMMLYHQLGGMNGGYRTTRFVQGGVGQLSETLAAVARAYGAEIESGVRVDSVIMDDERARGVILANGDAVAAQMIISNADPRRTFFDLVGGAHLEPTFMREVANIRYRGMTASVNLALSDLPAFTAATSTEQLTGYITIAPTMEYIERAYDAAKYGRISPKLVLEANIPSLLDPTLAPEGHHVMSITVQYTPYHLAEGNWDDQREKLGDQVVDTLAQYAPELPGLVVQRHVTTPLDWERDFSLTEGQIFHGQMGLDQLLFMRPVPGYANYRTPFEGLYLCGAGTHPGGGISGLPGYNAAKAVLKDWK